MSRIKKGIIIYYRKFLKNNLVMPTKSLSLDTRAHIIKLRHSRASCISGLPLVIAPGGCHSGGSEGITLPQPPKSVKKNILRISTKPVNFFWSYRDPLPDS